MVTIRKAYEQEANLLPEIERSSGEAFRQIEQLAWIADDKVQSVEGHSELIQLGTVWVAETIVHEIVGFLSAERIGEALHIWQMSVHINYQKQGIGSDLIEVAKSWASRHGLLSISLTTFRDVAWNEPFYRSCGFSIIDNGLPPLLKKLLAAEEQAGLPLHRRCAMICKLPPGRLS